MPKAIFLVLFLLTSCGKDLKKDALDPRTDVEPKGAGAQNEYALSCLGTYQFNEPGVSQNTFAFQAKRVCDFEHAGHPTTDYECKYVGESTHKAKITFTVKGTQQGWVVRGTFSKDCEELDVDGFGLKFYRK